MGQPEINSGIASITGPWIMREILGLSRTIEMTLTGRMATAEEALQLGLLHHVVAREEVFVPLTGVGKVTAIRIESTKPVSTR